MSVESCSSTVENCQWNYYQVIVRFWENDEKSVDFLREHGVLPKSVQCPRCDKPCTLRQDTRTWRCQKLFVENKKKPRRCTFAVADFHNTFLDNSRLPPWKIILFVNHFLSHLWDHKTVTECLGISPAFSVDWRSFCSEVTEAWFKEQEPIGGENIQVEIDETCIVRRKHERGRLITKQLWLLGGIERETKRRFVVPLTAERGTSRSKATLIPLIKKYVHRGSIIYTDAWRAYAGLGRLGYQHRVVNHSENFVDPEDSSVHTQNIERLWRDIKGWVRRPGIRAAFLEQYLGRYLFITSVANRKELLHRFFIEAHKLYRPGPPATD